MHHTLHWLGFAKSYAKSLVCPQFRAARPLRVFFALRFSH
jgi:hypothetical protein